MEERESESNMTGREFESVHGQEMERLASWGWRRREEAGEAGKVRRSNSRLCYCTEDGGVVVGMTCGTANRWEDRPLMQAANCQGLVLQFYGTPTTEYSEQPNSGFLPPRKILVVRRPRGLDRKEAEHIPVIPYFPLGLNQLRFF